MGYQDIFQNDLIDSVLNCEMLTFDSYSFYLKFITWKIKVVPFTQYCAERRGIEVDCSQGKCPAEASQEPWP